MKTKKILSILLALILCLTTITPGIAAAKSDVATLSSNMSSTFERDFATPINASNDAKPFIRWWIAPGRMTESETRLEMQNFAAGGYGGVELNGLELHTVQFNSPEWNKCMHWILDEADKLGLQVDVTMGPIWPLNSYLITDPINDERAEQRLAYRTTNITFDGVDPYERTEWSGTTGGGFNVSRAFRYVATTAAKQTDNATTFDPSTAVDITHLVNPATGALTWTPPSDGDWTIFDMLGQSTLRNTSGVALPNSPVINHLNKEATDLYLSTFTTAFESDPELKELYRKAGGYFFGDSLELTSATNWTTGMLEEFQTRRGYDITPYLPAILGNSGTGDASANGAFNFGDIGMGVRLDFAETVGDLFAENHIGRIGEWAEEELGMGIRYQAHGSGGAIYADVERGYLAADIPETESQARAGSLDFYRTGAAAAHYKNSIFSAEATSVPANGQAWRQAFMNYWTGASGAGTEVQGFMSWTNRLFAAGVNRLVFHGASYKITDFTNYSSSINLPGVSGQIYGNPSGAWPGYGYMQGMNYPNEWDDKQPNWEHFNVMTDYITRTQMVLQQGTADVDLAYYRLSTVLGNTNAGAMRDVEKYGYTLDIVAPSILELQTTGEKDGKTVLQPNGSDYKALVLDQRRNASTTTPFPMTLEIADKILEFAEAGLPIVIVGDPPTKVGSYPGDDDSVGSTTDFNADEQALAEKMAKLLTDYPNVTQISEAADIANQTGVAAALASLGVQPDAKAGVPADNNNMVVHRDGGDVEFYFFANDSQTASCSQTVTLKGTGKPYLLDAWSGKITPIAEYTAANGAVTLDVSLVANGQMIIAIAPDGYFSKSISAYSVDTDADAVVYSSNTALGARTTAADEYFVELSDGRTVEFEAEAAESPINLNDGDYTWNFVLHKWLPFTTATDTTNDYFLKTRIVDSARYSITSLVPWHEIDAANLTSVAGNGEYKTTFNLGKGWAEGQGAILQFTRVSDIMRVWVNGQEVNPDQIANRMDIGPYLLAGENELVVKVTSTMSNTKTATVTQFGIMGDVTITPYMQTAIQLSNPVIPGDPGTVTVTFNSNGGSAVASQGVKSGEMATQPAAPTRIGYTFGGWYTDSALTKPFSFSTPIEGNITLYAKWVKNTFADVAGHWAAGAINYVVDNGLMNGVDDTTFDPDGEMSRAMLVTVLYRLEGEPAVSATNPFTDVPSGQWYTNAVIWANANKIVEGYGGGRFGPNDNVTREQIAAIMMRYADWKRLNTSASDNLNGYTDAGRISPWASDAMKWANAEGLINGRTANTLSPGGTANRAEVATILMRFIEDFMKA